MTKPLAIGGRGAVLALLIALASVFGMAESARATVVTDLSQMNDGDSSTTSCPVIQGSMICNNDTAATSATITQGSGLIHDTLFTVGVSSEVGVTVEVGSFDPNETISAILYEWDGVGVLTPGSSPNGTEVEAASVSGGGACGGSCMLELTALVTPGNQYFVQVVGTPVTAGFYTQTVTVSQVPLPPAFLLLVTALLGLLGVKRFRHARAAV